jgi:hypothetical protein
LDEPVVRATERSGQVGVAGVGAPAVQAGEVPALLGAARAYDQVCRCSDPTDDAEQEPQLDRHRDDEQQHRVDIGSAGLAGSSEHPVSVPFTADRHYLSRTPERPVGQCAVPTWRCTETEL